MASSKDSLYRLSLKAIIKNDNGEVLVVKEGERESWSFPGGGLEHGEDIYSGLKRELYEEVLIDQPFVHRIVGLEEVLLLNGTRQMNLFFDVRIKDIQYGIGNDARAAKFIKPETFQNSPHLAEQHVYRYAAKELND